MERMQGIACGVFEGDGPEFGSYESSYERLLPAERRSEIAHGMQLSSAKWLPLN